MREKREMMKWNNHHHPSPLFPSTFLIANLFSPLQNLFPISSLLLFLSLNVSSERERESFVSSKFNSVNKNRTGQVYNFETIFLFSFSSSLPWILSWDGWRGDHLKDEGERR